MNIERYKKEKEELDKLYDSKNIIALSKCFLDLVTNNNDFLEIATCSSFEWAANLFKNQYEKDKAKFFSENGDFIDVDDVTLYKEIIIDTANYLNNNVGKDNILKYAFLSSAIANDIFSDGVKKEGQKYVDKTFVLGIDVILGNHCCRHKGNLIKNVLQRSTDTLKFGAGFEKDTGIEHLILGIKDNNKWIILDPSHPHIYFPKSNFVLGYSDDSLANIYIKSYVTYLEEERFNNIFVFYSFFNHLYEHSKLTIEEYKYYQNKIRTAYEAYNSSQLLKDLQEYIKPKVKDLQLIYNRKI